MKRLGPRYVFKSRWELPYRPNEVYDVLFDLLSYPKWWPQFRDVNRLDPDRHSMVVKSFLPYRITYLATKLVADRARGVLHARVTGDIDGGIRWEIDPSPSGSVVNFEERVQTTRDVLNLLAPVARWGFEFNHRVMMRDGYFGLLAFLAGSRKADPEPAPPIYAAHPQRNRAGPGSQKAKP